jgi:hypothetical protein
MTTRQSSATDRGATVVAALATCDYPRLAGTLAADVRMRALIPPGPIEVAGAEAVAAKLTAWFGDMEELELVRSGCDAVADRLHVFYRLRVKRRGDAWKLVEQHLLCAFRDDGITAIDLVCSGFRPDDELTPSLAAA